MPTTPSPDTPGASAPPRAGRSRRSRSLRCECRLLGGLVLGGKRVPPGRCWVRQIKQVVLLTWAADDGGPRQHELSVEGLRQLLDEGVLERVTPR